MSRVLQILFALLPLYLVRLKVFGVPTNAFEAGFFAVFFAAVVLALRKRELKKLLSLPEEKTFRVGLVLLFMGVLSSLVFWPTLHGLGIVKSWFIVPFLFFLLVRFAFRGESAARKLFGAYVVSALGVGAVALAYAARGLFTFDGRLSAFFGSPNHLAMYVAPALIVLGAKIKDQRSKIENLLSILCFVLFALVLYLTQSHGAWLGVAGALLLGWLTQKLSARMRGSIVVAVIIGGILAPLLVVRSWLIWQNTFNIPERSSAASRMIIWRSALAIGRDNPVFGIGPGNFQKQYLGYQKNYPSYLEWAVPQPHNLFLAFWLQTGLAGFAGFLLLLFWFFRKAFELYPLPSTLYPLLPALMLYVLLHGSVDTLYWKNDLAVFFWMLLAAASPSAPAPTAYSSGQLPDQKYFP